MGNLVSSSDSVQGNLYCFSADAAARQNHCSSPTPWQWITVCPLTPTSSRLPPGIAQASHPQWSVLVQRLFTQVALMRRTGPHPHSSYVNMCCSDVWRTCTTDRTALLVFKVTPVQDPFHSLWVKGVSEFKVRTLTWQLVILADVLTFGHLRGKL